MRISLSLAIIVVVFSGQALAAKGKKAAPKGPVATLDGNDPAAKEISEKKEAEAKPDTEEQQEHRELQLDAADVAKSREGSKVGVFGNVLIGFGEAPEPGAGANQTSGKTTSATFMVGGHYDLSPELTLGLRIPWTVGSARQTDGLHQTSAALGAPELLAEYRVALSPFTRVPLFFGIGIPIAQGDNDSESGLRQVRLNEMADAASGFRDPELFGPKRLPIVLGGGIDYTRKALNVHAANKLVFGVKVGGKIANPNDPAGHFEFKSVSFRNVTSGGVAYQFLDRPQLYGALDSWFAISAIDRIEFESNQGAGKPNRFQVVFEPRVGAHFGKISPSLGYIFPIGGRLADTGASGLELHCDVAF